MKGGGRDRARLHGKGRRLKGLRAEEWKLGACISLRLSDNSFLFHTQGRLWLAFLSKLTRGHAPMPGLRPRHFRLVYCPTASTNGFNYSKARLLICVYPGRKLNNKQGFWQLNH